MYIIILQRIAIDFCLHLIYFPVWWYTGGMKRAFLGTWNLLRMVNSYLAPGLWLKNIFVPMFGQRDWQGRLVSFFMRLVNVIFRFLGLFVWFWIVLLLFLLWPIFPLFVVTMLIISLLPTS